MVKIQQPPSHPFHKTLLQLKTQHQPQTPADPSAPSPQESSSVITSPASISCCEELLLKLLDTLFTGGTVGAFTPFPGDSVALALATTALKALVALTFCWDRL